MNKEIDEIIKELQEGNMTNFEVYYEKYNKIIHSYCNKYLISITKASKGMYTYEDMFQELWYRLLKQISKYDSTRASHVSWIYMICSSQSNMIIRELNRDNKLDEKFEIVNINSEVYGKDNSVTEVIDIIADPMAAFEKGLISKHKIYNFIYLFYNSIKGLPRKYKLAYYNFLNGYGHNDISNILGVGRSYISRLVSNVQDKTIKIWTKLDEGSYNDKEAIKFGKILLSDMSDDEIHETYGYDLAGIKICRSALYIAKD